MKKNDPIKDRFEDTAHDLHEYGNLRREDLKLKLLEKLSGFFNSILSTFILIFLGAITILFVSAVLTLLLAQLVGSFLAATAIIAGVFIIVTLIIFLRRKKLFLNTMVRMLAKMLFEKDKED